MPSLSWARSIFTSSASISYGSDARPREASNPGWQKDCAYSRLSSQHTGNNGQVFQEYCREYKRRFAWIKAGKPTEEQFAAWQKAAKAKKKGCDRGAISLDAFKAWLKDS